MPSVPVTLSLIGFDQKLSKTTRLIGDHMHSQTARFARSAQMMLTSLCMLSMASSAWAEAWPNADAQAQAWRTDNPEFHVIVDSLYAPGGLHTSLLGVPYFAASKNNSLERRYMVEYFAEHAARRFKQIKLPAPRNEVESDEFQLYFVEDLGAAAAAHGPGSSNQAAAAMNSDTYYMRVSNIEGFENKNDWPIYPYKVGASIAHELFHGVQERYPELPELQNNIAHDGKWYTEGLPDALGQWAIRGASVLKQPSFSPESSFKSGNCRFAKALGLRPYDYPLELSSAPSAAPWTACLTSPPTAAKDFKEVFSYQTSSFWRFIFNDSVPAGQEFRQLNAFANRNTTDRTSRARAALKLTDAGLKAVHPTWKKGLYDAYPAFIAHWVNFPAKVMQSKQGVFADAQWMRYVFADGCKTVSLGKPLQFTEVVQLRIRPNAAACVRVKWEGLGFRPVQVYSRLEIVGKANMDALEGIRLGVHGEALGLSTVERFLDSNTQKERLRYAPTGGAGLVSFIPEHPDHTGDEVIYTITNLQKDPLKTQEELVTLSLSTSSFIASGAVTHAPKSSDPENPAPPPSKPKITGKLNQHTGAVRDNNAISVTLFSGEYGDKLQHCTPQNTGIGTLAVPVAPHGSPFSPAANNGCPLGQAMTGGIRAIQAIQQGTVELNLTLPNLPQGRTGVVNDAEVNLRWFDPHPKLGDIHVDADHVTVTISENTADHIKGKLIAQFNNEDTNGQIQADFMLNILDDDQHDLIISNDVTDVFSTGWWMAYALGSAGTLPHPNFLQQIQATASEQETFGDYQGRKIIRRGTTSAAAASSGIARAASTAQCSCDCAEFNQPNRREQCASQCLSYAPMSAQCVIQRNVAQGRPEAQVINEINACPTQCSSLINSRSGVCQDAFFAQRRACMTTQSSGLSLQQQTDCYVNFVVREMPEPMKSEMRQQLQTQFQSMDDDAKRQFLGMMLEPLKQQGVQCGG